MRTARVAIVGGGLAGLHAARLLEQQGVHDYLLLDARDRWGGRVLCTSDLPPDDSPGRVLDHFDLGPTWFWPAYQSQLDRLIDSLGLRCFAQHEDGDMVVERAPNAVPARMRGYASEPTAMRLIGGMGALVDALHQGLARENLLLGQRVRHLRRDGPQVALDTEDARGQTIVYRADRVLLAVPPRLATATIGFTPALPEALMRSWQDTATWMAPHAKYVALYDEAFWREQGLSGEARSALGPLTEIHDASMPGGHAALFGFFGIPAQVRQEVSDEALRIHCRAQFARLFGERAAQPRADFIKDWSRDPWTATEEDQDAIGHHGIAPAAAPSEGPWQGRIVGIASEWSPRFPGHVAGAIEAATAAVTTLLEQRA